MAVRVRPLRPSDAEAYVDLLAWLYAESRYPVVNLLERSKTPEEWRRAMAKIEDEGRRILLVAEELPDGAGPEGAGPESAAEGEAGAPPYLVGFLSTNDDSFSGLWDLRIVVGLREAYTGQGIGTRLFEALENWARPAGVERLYLTVETDNERALALYHKMGFAVEGHIREAVQIEGRWVDDYVMFKNLLI